MNEVFIMGKVVSKVEFDFVYKGTHISKAKCEIEISNKSKIQIIGYDNIADFMYQSLKESDVVFIYGRISGSNLILKQIQKIIRLTKREKWKINKKSKKDKKKIIALIILVMSPIILIYSGYQIIYWVKSNIELKRMKKVLAEVVKIEENEDENGEVTKTIDFEKLLETNKDVVGWISIKNTKVDYAIVQGKDNEYYLKRNINKKKS